MDRLLLTDRCYDCLRKGILFGVLIGMLIGCIIEEVILTFALGGIFGIVISSIYFYYEKMK